MTMIDASVNSVADAIMFFFLLLLRYFMSLSSTNIMDKRIPRESLQRLG
jgi:hypothetical protein